MCVLVSMPLCYGLCVSVYVCACNMCVCVCVYIFEIIKYPSLKHVDIYLHMRSVYCIYFYYKFSILLHVYLFALYTRMCLQWSAVIGTDHHSPSIQIH